MLLNDGALRDHLVPRESALDPWVIMSIKFSWKDLPISGSEWQRIMERGDGFWRFHTKSVPVIYYYSRKNIFLDTKQAKIKVSYSARLWQIQSRALLFSLASFSWYAPRDFHSWTRPRKTRSCQLLAACVQYLARIPSTSYPTLDAPEFYCWSINRR